MSIMPVVAEKKPGKSSNERWGGIFGIDQKAIEILRKREGGSVNDTDGLFQVTQTEREDSWQRIPRKYLSVITKNTPELWVLFPKGDSLNAFLTREDNCRQVRLKVFENYQDSEEIQTFWGLWFFKERCQPFGEYLRFLNYNHPRAVWNESEEYNKCGLINQLMISLNIDRPQTIDWGNQLVGAIDLSLRRKASPFDLSFTISPTISYDSGRNWFFWNFTINGEAVIENKKVPFVLRSAHYLWSLPIDQTDQEFLKRYAQSAIERAYNILGIAKKTSQNEGQRGIIRNKLLDKDGNPRGILALSKTSLGIMDLLRNE